jgi:putative peptide zinc metalloprotease protein
LVEIVWFVLRPIWDELRVWFSLRSLILRRARSYASAAGALALVALATIPLPERVEIEAILEPQASHRLTAIYPARIDAIERRAGARLKQGDVVMRLSSPLLTRDLERARAKLALNQIRLSRRAADAEDRAATLVLEREETSLRTQIASLEHMAQDLVIRAPADGALVDIPPEMTAGRWVARGEELGVILSSDRLQLRGYAADHAAARLTPGAHGRFIPDDLTQPSRSVRLKEIAATAATSIEIPYLTTTNAGRIAVLQDRSRDEPGREDRARAAVPSQAQVLTILEASDEADDHTSDVQSQLPILRGLARMDARAESYAARAMRHAAAVLIRETGF